MVRNRRLLPLVLAVATAFAVAACGSDDGDGDSAGASGTGGAVVAKDARGEQTLDAPATKVVALEWSYAENLVTLGVDPVGVADVEGYANWVSAVDLPESTKDVGTRQEPNLDLIAELRPDLIVTDLDRSADNLDELEDIAPVLQFNYYDPDRPQLDSMRQNFTELAKAVGKEDAAAEALDKLDATIADGKSTLADAGLGGQKFVLAQGYTVEEVPTVRIFGSTSMASNLVTELGLDNAWTEEPDKYGLSDTDVEGLTAIGDAQFVYVAQDDDNIFTGPLASNPIWTSLPFVQAGKVHPIDPGTWFYGGPETCQQIIGQVVDALTV